MMTAVDGWIDCAMTAQPPGVEEYYKTLNALDVPTTLSGRTTAQLEMAEPGTFTVTDPEVYGRGGFSCKAEAAGYEVIVDTNGTLLWQLDLSRLGVNMFSAVNDSLINDSCRLYRGRLILPYEHLSRFQND